MDESHLLTPLTYSGLDLGKEEKASVILLSFLHMGIFIMLLDERCLKYRKPDLLIIGMTIESLKPSFKKS